MTDGALKPLPTVLARQAGFDPNRLAEVDTLLREAIHHAAFPGAVLVVGTRAGVVVRKAFGALSYSIDARVVEPETIYDLASLTKVVATTTIAMRLVDRQALDLDVPLFSLVQEWWGRDREHVRVRDALAHTTGLPAWAPLYEDVQGRQAYVERIVAMPLDYEPRTRAVYSDLGFILLGIGLERLTDHSLDALAQAEVFDLLGMRTTRFNPPAGWIDRIAPTENDPWRGHLLRGEVHDENAFALGGVAAHAGLFGTADDLARFCALMVARGAPNNHVIVSRETFQRFVTQSGEPGSSRALGWDTPGRAASCGERFSRDSVGHTGFTGTSIWIDLARGVYVILLTNRVHPSRQNDAIKAIRPQVHNAVLGALRP